jgi:hypothetical protein
MNTQSTKGEYTMLKKVMDMKLSRIFIAAFLAAIMLLSLTACASSGASDVPPKFDALLSKYGARGPS